MKDKQGYVYILTNKHNNVLYVGVSSNLLKRTWEHKNKVVKGFTQKYNVDKLIYYEAFGSILYAIEREKYIKGKKREYKLGLIKKMNPKYKDLYQELL